MFTKKKGRPAETKRVGDDWVSPLPREKTDVFEAVVQRWESTYAMMSVALDEAISLRVNGQLVCAHQQVWMAADLFDRVSRALMLACNVLALRGETVREVPSVEPLRTRFFRGDTAQSAASWNGILHHVTFGNRPRFVHKLRILSATVRELNAQFSETAGEIRDRLSVAPSNCWQKLDSLHYDFNTCLREAEIVLKSYLRTMPSEHLAALAEELSVTPTEKNPLLQRRLFRAPA